MPGLNSTVYIMLSALLYLVLFVILFFTVKSKFRAIFLTKSKELLVKLDGSGKLVNITDKVNAVFWKPVKNGFTAGLISISKLSNEIAERQNWLKSIKIGEPFDIFALLLRKLYSPEPFVVLSYSAILFVVFYFILTIF